MNFPSKEQIKIYLHRGYGETPNELFGKLNIFGWIIVGWWMYCTLAILTTVTFIVVFMAICGGLAAQAIEKFFIYLFGKKELTDEST